MTDLTAPIFTDPEAARKHLESIRWPDGPYCPHCGECENVKELKGKSHRPGLHKCYSCKKNFTVTVKSIFERSKIPLNKWIAAVHLMAASKKGISAHQIHRMLGVTYKTAWFMCHRIREAMSESAGGTLLGGGGGMVEADETYWGHSERRNRDYKHKARRGYEHKEKIFTMVERGGKVRSHHVPVVNGETLGPILKRQIAHDAQLMTDQHGIYKSLAKKYNLAHHSVNHGIGEYVRGPLHTNTVESYFSILKRGLVGTFHHVSPEHLKRYVGEFDFRYNYRTSLDVNDDERARMILANADNKRLTYREPKTHANHVT